MGLAPLDLIVVVAYFVVVAAIGFAATRSIRTREDYLMGGRRFGKAMMIMFSFGSGTHADHAVGVAAQSYKFGLSGIWYQWIGLFTLPIYWLLAPIFRRARVLTTADFFERRFGAPMMYVYTAFSLFVALTYTGVMFYGSAKVVEALTGGAIGVTTAIVLMAVVSCGYGIAGGLVAAVWNDFFQGILTIVMSLLIIPFFWARIGGIEGFRAAIAASGHPRSDELFSLVLGEDMTVFWIVMMTISSLVSMVTQPQIMASTAAARTEMDSRVGFTGGIFLKRLMTVPWALTGLMAIALYGYSPATDPDHTFGRLSADLLPTGFVGLMLACVMASVMDNCAVSMLGFAGIYTSSIHQRFFEPQAGERRLVLVNRIASAVFACVAIAISFLFTDMPSALRFTWQTVPLMGISWFLAVLWPRANRWGAIASFAAALAATALAKFVLPEFTWLGIRVTWANDAGLPFTVALYMLVGITAGVVVSLLTPPEDPRRTEHFFLLLKTPIGQEHVLREAGFRQLAGDDTFEFPATDEAPPSAAGRPLAAWLPRIDRRESVRQAAYGFVAMALVVAAMLASVIVLAGWMAGRAA